MNTNEMEIGIHLMLTPADDSYELPSSLQTVFESTTHSLGQANKCFLKALHVRPDHVHLLFQSAEEDEIEHFVHELLLTLKNVVQQYHDGANRFQWNEHVHITLLPPWHIEILASFVRDQDRFHQNRTFDQELNEIFMPNAAMSETPTFN